MFRGKRRKQEMTSNGLARLSTVLRLIMSKRRSAKALVGR